MVVQAGVLVEFTGALVTGAISTGGGDVGLPGPCVGVDTGCGK